MQTLQALRTEVTATFSADAPTHTSDHLQRVENLATKIAMKEGANLFITAAAAWVHDLHRDIKLPPGTQPDETDALAISIMERADVPQTYFSEVLSSVHHTDSFSFSDRPLHKASIEAQCLRDADNLDAIGAIGIARTFSYGGRHGIPIWDPSAPIRQGTYCTSQREPSTIHHFYGKLLRLKDDFETETGRHLARKRTQYMEDFVTMLLSEWAEAHSDDFCECPDAP